MSTRLRVFVFPDRADALLIHIDEGHEGPLVLPPIPFPFAKGDVASALGDAGIRSTVTESVPGRWSYALTKAKLDESAERRSLNKKRESHEAAILLGSVDPSEKTRATLLQQMNEVGAEIADLKKKIGIAKSNAYTHGQYMPPSEFRRLKGRLEAAKVQSQAILAQLSEAKRATAEKNRKENDTFLRRFHNLVRDVLDEDEFNDLVSEARGDNDNDEESP